jgi:hypothetical protein
MIFYFSVCNRKRVNNLFIGQTYSAKQGDMTSCDEPEKVGGKPQNLFYEGFLAIEDLP